MRSLRRGKTRFFLLVRTSKRSSLSAKDVVVVVVVVVIRHRTPRAFVVRPRDT